MMRRAEVIEVVMVLSGWSLVWAIAGVLLAVATAAVRRAVRGWRSGAAVVLSSFALIPFLANHLFGDVSRLLPAEAFADGADGKDQIIVAGILWGFLFAVIVAATTVATARWLGRFFFGRA
jgi:hypothetical protein